VSTSVGPVRDKGHIRHMEPAHGWVAVFAIPTFPFYSVLPISHFVLVKRDGQETTDALVPLIGQRELQFLSQIEQGEFMFKVYTPLYTNPPFVSEDGSTTAFDNALTGAAARGQELAALAHTQSAYPEGVE
jgi:hypothetical protein